VSRPLKASLERPTEDYLLLQAWRAGDQDAGNRVVRRHFAAVHRFFLSKLDRDVDELLQRTFLACLQAADRFWPNASLRAFLLEIARRQLLKYFEQSRRDGKVVDLAETPVAALYPSPSCDIDHRQQTRLLLHALRRMPLDLQIAVELYYWENLSTAEIAAILDIPPGTVKSRLFRGRKLLSENLNALEQADNVWRTTVDSLRAWADGVRKLARDGDGQPDPASC
jgi:RNA polymerase sigma-70 factor (ECF subfamily)